MAQLILPSTIAAGAPMVAAEVQGNDVAIRDLVNGSIEGRAGVFRNLAPRTIDAQDLKGNLPFYLASQRELQAGVVGAGDGKVTPGAGLVLNIAAGTVWILDSSNLVAGSAVGGQAALIPALITAGTLTIPANASGNPRVDQIIATLTDFGTATLSVLQGTAAAGATLDNAYDGAHGTAALPASSIRLADILMPSGFAGPFIQTTHIRDRRPWARGARRVIIRTANAAAGSDYTSTNTAITDVDATNLVARMEITTGLVRATLLGRARSSGTVAQSITLDISMDGTGMAGGSQHMAGSTLDVESGSLVDAFAAASVGSHVFKPTISVSSGTTGTLLAQAGVPLIFIVQELVLQNADNAGA